MCQPISPSPPLHQPLLDVGETIQAMTTMKRRVSFSSAIEEHPARDIDVLDDEQLQTLWYTRSERREIRRRAKRILQKEIECHDSDDCLRGLEWSGDRRRSKQIASKIDLILERQIHNWHAGIEGDSGLSALSQSLSRVDVRFSVKQAEMDYAEVYRGGGRTM